ncbi:MAG: hypothetical protein GY751_18050 [Bacteroidetes bacterium]|nr:hypothetical protein [Bacteroidota bacterium]
MLQIIICILLGVSAMVLFIAYLQKRTDDAAQRFRRVSIGVPAVIVPLLEVLAVAPQRLLLGVGVAVFLRETFYILGYDSKSKRLNGMVDFLPVAIAVAFFYPYMSMLSLFFGFDLAIFFVAGVIAVSYLFIKGREQKKYHLPFNAVLLFCSCIILGWAVLMLYDRV